MNRRIVPFFALLALFLGLVGAGILGCDEDDGPDPSNPGKSELGQFPVIELSPTELCHHAGGTPDCGY